MNPITREHYAFLWWDLAGGYTICCLTQQDMCRGDKPQRYPNWQSTPVGYDYAEVTQ